VFSEDRVFDEPNWGTFDTNDDMDSVWGFNASSITKEVCKFSPVKYCFSKILSSFEGQACLNFSRYILTWHHQCWWFNYWISPAML
jgi:hypothetical protein